MNRLIDNNEHDALGELFRRKLENHQIAVDGNGWSEIERRLGKRKNNKAAIWWWCSGAAAAIALLLLISQPATDEAPVVAVAQQIDTEAPAMADNQETMPTAEEQATTIITQPDSVQPAETAAPFKQHKAAAQEIIPSLSNPIDSTEQNKILIAATDDIQTTQTEENKPAIIPTEKEIPLLDFSLIDHKVNEEIAANKTNKWLVAAAFGIGGYTASTSEERLNNDYVATRAESIQSFNDMVRNDFTNIHHSLPLSFGIMVRKNLGKHIGIESGLVYTYLSSRFEWFDYDVHQSLHYLGIPVNVVVYLWNSNSNWRVYFSGGFMVEKGLRGIYRQEIETWALYTTTVKSSIDGLQWSLNGAFGINYLFKNGIGIYFEPRAGYCFDNSQPISMRTEWPLYIGINLGLNYEF